MFLDNYFTNICDVMQETNDGVFVHGVLERVLVRVLRSSFHSSTNPFSNDFCFRKVYAYIILVRVVW